MYKIDIEIDGMMCGMCEAHVADVIRKTVNDARKVAVSHTKGTAVFLTEEKPDEDKIKDAIDATGYTVMSMKCDISMDMCYSQKVIKKPEPLRFGLFSFMIFTRLNEKSESSVS
ncbi:MAG: heavy-metal-associated domain-containing protein [Lachnospiraceae bacterium]|nr:heavy-metal-associated domain-containing protein [Lachnospiraceae bacterium]